MTLAPNVIDNLNKKKNVSMAIDVSNASHKPAAVKFSSKEVSNMSSKGVKFAEPFTVSKEDSIRPNIKPPLSRCSSKQNVVSFLKTSQIASVFKKHISRKSSDYLAPIFIKRKSPKKI